jgi:hypothetical protein
LPQYGLPLGSLKVQAGEWNMGAQGGVKLAEGRMERSRGNTKAA